MVTYLSDNITARLNKLMTELDVGISVKLRACRGSQKYVIVSLKCDTNMDWREYPQYLSTFPDSVFEAVSDELGVRTTSKLLESPNNVREAIVLARKMDMENNKWQKI